MGTALAEGLTARGWPVVCRPPLTDPAQLASIGETPGMVAVFIHLNPPGTEALFTADDEARLKHVFLLAGRLKAMLTAAAQHSWAAFMTVTHLDGMLGLTGGSPLAGGFFGLTKTLALEWPAVHCRAVDLSPTLPIDRAVNCILAELHDPNRRLVEVGWSASGRVTLVAEGMDFNGWMRTSR